MAKAAPPKGTKVATKTKPAAAAKTAAKKPVKNAELWQALEAERNRHDVTLHWVKGHAGHEENERADELARQGMEPFKQGPGR